VGEKTRKVKLLLATQQTCCFCGGVERATTIDHQPSRSIFDRREWPEGYVFPACERCNQQSKHAENVLGLIVRINSEREDDPIRRTEFKKFLGAMRNNFPDLLKPLSARDKRRFLKSENLIASDGVASLHMAGISADESERTIEVCLHKICLALHYKHTGNIVPSNGGIYVHWFTNAYTHHFEREFSDFRNLPIQPLLVRNGRDLSDQFAYKYGLDPSNRLSAYILRFRLSLIAVGVVAEDAPLEQT
jgi:hypothetical protein